MMFPRRKMTPASALVTGATSGIGRAFATMLPLTTDLLLVGRDVEALAALEIGLASADRTVRTCAADLATEEGRAAVVAAAEAAGIDLLINNAGMGSMGSFLDNDPERELATVQVNVVAVMMLTRRLLPGMIDRARLANRRAGLINVASTAAFVPVPRFAVYAATKAFVLSFTESLAAELMRKPIDVTAMCPGPVRTAFAGRAGYEGRQMPGAIDAETVARAALDQLGQRSVSFSDPVSAATLRGLALARATLARTFHIGLGVGERMRGGFGGRRDASY